MKVAKAKGRLRGKQPKLNPRQKAHMVALLKSGEYSSAELGDLFGVARSTVYRAAERDAARKRTQRQTAASIRRSGLYRPPRIRAIVMATSLWLAGVPQDYPLFGTSPASARGRRPVSVIGRDWDVLRWVKPAGPVHSSRSGGSHRPDSTSPAEAAERALCGLPSHQRPVHAAERRGSRVPRSNAVPNR